MKILNACGDFSRGARPTLAVSGGRDGVHLSLRETDEDSTRSVMAWFDPAELIAAIQEASA